MPVDQYQREINYLRISRTDHCNLRCVYCMPINGLKCFPREELLTPSEIADGGNGGLKGPCCGLDAVVAGIIY